MKSELNPSWLRKLLPPLPFCSAKAPADALKQWRAGQCVLSAHAPVDSFRGLKPIELEYWDRLARQTARSRHWALSGRLRWTRTYEVRLDNRFGVD